MLENFNKQINKFIFEFKATTAKVVETRQKIEAWKACKNCEEIFTAEHQCDALKCH